MKACINCGTKLEDDTLFCSGCGTKQPTPEPSPAKAPTAKKSGKKAIIAVIAIIVAFVMLIVGLAGGIGIGFLIGKGDTNPAPDETTEANIVVTDIPDSTGNIVAPTEAPTELTTKAPTEIPETTIPEPVFLLAEGYYFPASANGDLNLDNYIKVDDKLVSIQINLMEAVIMAEATYTVEDNKIILDELLWTNTTVCDEGVILEVYGDCIYVYNFESNFALQGWMCPQDYLDGNGFYK